MISNLKKTAQRIAGEKSIAWHSGLENKFWKLDKDVESGRMNKQDAIKIAATELKISLGLFPAACRVGV